METLKIASIGYTHEGGAGLSSLKLPQEFLNQVHESKFFVLSKKKDLKNVVRLKSNGNSESVNTIPLKEGKINIISSGMATTVPQTLEGIYDWADVILLRWVTGTISDFQIGLWSHRHKPLIWCLSDMEPFTGGCHYSEGCSEYKRDCKDCHLVNPKFKLSPSLGIKRKKLWGNITVVSPSSWLYKCCKESTVFKEKEIKKIRTGIELDIFKPYSEVKSREDLNLPQNKKIIFVASHSVSDPRKGLDLFQKSVTFMKKNHDIDKFVFVTAGHDSINLNGVSHIHLGYINDKAKLAKIYSASNLTALPYREDNLPNVLLESIACGTPVCSFDIGGMPDVIINGFNGYLVPPFNSEAFAEKINSLLHYNFNKKDIREWAYKELNIKDQAEKYIELFKEKLAVGKRNQL